MKKSAVGLLGLGLLLAFGCLKATTSGDKNQAAGGGEKAIVLFVDDLRQQHAANETAAEQKFKNQILEVTGSITAIYRESPLTGIGFGLLQDLVPPVLCEMDRQQLNALSQLSAGQVVTVRGLYMGKIQGGWIGLGNCRLVTGSGK
jgi:hypothetical protein